MIAATVVTGDHETGEDEVRSFTEGVPDVHMSLAGEARCNGDEYDGAPAYCTACGDRLNDEGESVDPGHLPAGQCDAAADAFGPHLAAPLPLTWANSASIRADESGDRLTVAISVGDPRGAFTMSVERVRWTDAETGEERDELRLSVPTPDGSLPHMTLTPLASPGYFRVS